MGAPALPPAPRPTEPPPGIAVVRDHSDRVEQGDGSWKWFPGYFHILLCAVERRCIPAGANPARQLSLQPEAVGAVQGGNELH